MKIVDSHVHWWNPKLLRYEWLDGLPALKRAFGVEEFAAATEGKVSKIIFVEGGCDSSQRWDELEWASALAKKEPRLKGIVAQGLENLEKLAAYPLVKGVRRNLQGERDKKLCGRPEFIEAVKSLARFGFTFDVCVRHEQLSAVGELVRRIPEVMFVLDHLGKPDVRGKMREPWATDFRALAVLPNVVCKISGLATEADWEKWQPSDLEFYISRTLECFGFDRLLFGGDWPVATLATTWQRWLETVREFVSWASEAQQTKFFQTNAERIYRV